MSEYGFGRMVRLMLTITVVIGVGTGVLFVGGGIMSLSQFLTNAIPFYAMFFITTLALLVIMDRWFL